MPLPLSWRVPLPLFLVVLLAGLPGFRLTAQEPPAKPVAQARGGARVKGQTLAQFRTEAQERYRAGTYAEVAKLATGLLNEGPGAFGLRLADVDDSRLLDLLLVGQVRSGDLAGATRLLHRRRELEPRDAGSYYCLALAYLGRGLNLPAVSMLEEARVQPAGTAASRAASDLLRTLPATNWADPRLATELTLYAAEYVPLQRALEANRAKALMKYHIPVIGKALEAASGQPLNGPPSPRWPRTKGDKYSQLLQQVANARIEMRHLIHLAAKPIRPDSKRLRAELENALIEAKKGFDARGEAETHYGFGVELLALGEPRRAADQLIAALETYRGLGDRGRFLQALIIFEDAFRSIEAKEDALIHVPRLLDLVLGRLPNGQLAKDS